jgi:hypothetical protein
LALILSVSLLLAPLETALAQEGPPPEQPSDPSPSTTPADDASPAPDFSIPGVDDQADATPSEAATPDTSEPSAADTPVAAADPGNTPPTSDVPDNQTTDTTSTDDTQDTEAKPPEESQSMLSGSFGDGSPTLANPNVFTSESTAPKADGQTGALVQTVPLDIPPGRNGLQPSLALKYNSQNTDDSIVGYGWSLTIPYIQRLNKIGSQALYNYPAFSSSIDGELATSSTSTTAYMAKVDDGSFDAYTFSNNVWTMYDKEGTRYTFGASDNAQQNAAASSTQIYKWMLQEIRDTNNNFVRFVYAKDSGQIYPIRILYTGNGGTDGIFSIAFATSTRPDPYFDYRPLFKVTTSYRVSQITASINGTVVREYNLSYVAGNNGARSLLSGIQENGWDAAHANEVTYPALSLGYISSTTSFVWPNGGDSAVRVAADVNGDALLDTSIFYRDTFGATNDGFVDDKGVNYVNVSPTPDYWSQTVSSGCSSYSPVERGSRYADVNADGKADLMQGLYNYTTKASTSALWINRYPYSSPTYYWLSTTTWVIADCRAGKIATVIVQDPERLSRDTGQLLALLQIFQEAGVHVEFDTGDDPVIDLGLSVSRFVVRRYGRDDS